MLCLIFCHRLTLGLMGLDELHLRVLATSSEDLTEKRNAQKGALPNSPCLISQLIKLVHDDQY